MRGRFILAIGCMFFLFVSSTSMAVEPDTASESVKTVAVVGNVDNASETGTDPKLQKWLQGIKPAAGVNYWEQKVVRRSSRRMVTNKK